MEPKLGYRTTEAGVFPVWRLVPLGSAITEFSASRLLKNGVRRRVRSSKSPILRSSRRKLERWNGAFGP